MPEGIARLALRLAGGAVAAAVVWWWSGPVTAALVLAATALLLARPLLEAAADLRRSLRAAAYRDVEGRHFAFHGRPLRVLEDAEHRRWVRVDDVRAIVGFTASDGALELTYPGGFRRCGRDAFVSDEALLVHLAREPGAPALKLRQWVEREIAFPARRVRERLGIRIAAPEVRADD
jgi:hypothetical protein